MPTESAPDTAELNRSECSGWGRRMSDLFISHDSNDSALAERLHRALTARGVSVWLDSEDILPGARWVQKLESGLQACRAFAVIATRKAMLSRFVATEYAVAVTLAHEPDRQLQLIALVFEDVKLPLILSTFQYVDFRAADHFERSVVQLCRGIISTHTSAHIASPPASVAEANSAGSDMQIKLRYVHSEVRRERDTLGQLKRARLAAVAIGALVAAAVSVSGLGASNGASAALALATMTLITAAGWSATFPSVTRTAAHIAELELLREGLSNCRDQRDDVCVEWRAQFWRVLPSGLAGSH
jgi:hypothetical protein